MPKSPRFLAMCLVPLGVCLSSKAHAANLKVSNLNDSGAGSLRAQIAAAASGDTIDFSVTGTITLSSGEIAIAKNLTISGSPGTSGITISGNGASRVFNISGGSVLLSRLTISGGNGGATGGAINNSGALTLLYCTVSGSSATNGAGIYNAGSATIDSCTFSGNSGGNGGALYNTINASLTVKNSTLTGNSAGGEGGGIYNLGATTISSSTIVENSATGSTGGGGIGQGAYVGSFTNLSNSILAGNTGYLGNSSDFRGVVSGDYNLVQNAGSQGNFGSNTITGISPNLGVLADNGGLTKTMALLSNSQALNAGNPGFDAVATPYDQRGEGYARKLGNAVDLGAVESAFTNRVPVAANTAFIVTPNTAFSGALPASDRDSGDTLTYTIVTGTLPTGLTFDTATGIISGTTGGFAARTLTFKATDSNGADSNTATATLGAMEINSLLVNTNSDAANNTDGLTSIREAVAYANTVNAGDSPVITFAPDVTGTITLSTATSGVMTISRSMTITGPGAGSLTLTGINGNGARSIFRINAGTVGISGLTLSKGMGTFYTVASGAQAVRSGGALYITDGAVTVTNCTLSSNTGSIGYGGAIFMTGGGLSVSSCLLSQNSSAYGGAICLRGNAVATIANSTLSGNFASTGGGSVYTYNGTDEVAIRNSTLSGNTSNGAGGAVLTNGGPVTIANSTLSGNQAKGSTNGYGGGIYIGGSGGGTTITNSTLTNNSAIVGGNFPGGGGIYGGPVSMSNTIVCDNYAYRADSINIANATITGTHNLINQDAKLGLLADNGGPTKTHKPLTGSPAIDAGDPNFDVTILPYDQRGAGFPRILGGRMDIGAYETERDQGGSVVVVNTLADGDDGAAGLSNCTLREAVKYAPAGSTISFSVNGVITLTQGEIVIAKNLTIAVPSDSPGITVSGNNASRIFSISNSLTNGAVELHRLTLSGGNGAGASYNGSGGAMINLVSSTTVTVNECTFSGNSSTLSGDITFYGGGAIHNSGTLIVTNSTFSGNSAGHGGAIRNDNLLALTNSTFSGNSASSNGGGIYCPYNFGSLTLSNSTFSGNSALSGGGIFNAGTMPVAINNSIVAGNTATTGPDISGAIAAGGYNLVGKGDASTGLANASNGNQVGTAAQPVDPQLGTLAANGGPTTTMALLPGSPCINAGSNALVPNGLTTDQRAFSRIDSGVVDIGAFEVQPPPPLVSISPTLAQNEGDSGTTTFLFTVTRSGDTARTSTVAYSVAARSATAGVDYGDASDSDGGSPGIINFAAGQTNASIVVPVVGDQGLELDENFTVTLSRAALTGTPMVFGTIQNDDSGLVVTTNSDTTPVGNDNNNTLREAAARALSTLSGTNPGVSFAPNVTGEIILTSALPNLSKSMTVTGPGAGLLTVRPATDFAFAVFTNDSGVSSTLGGLTISKGAPGIINSGTLTLLDCVVTANRSTGELAGGAYRIGGTGGGIYNKGALSLTRCVVTANQVAYINSTNSNDSRGGGIFSQGGSLTMVNCTVSNNTVSSISVVNRLGGGIHASAGTIVNLIGCTVSGNLLYSDYYTDSDGYGGGIYVTGSSTVLNASNCTLSGNRAESASAFGDQGRGGGICQESGIVTLANCTVSGNTSTHGGGGLYGTFNLSNTIVAGNTSGSGPDFFGTLTSQGYNLIGNSSGATISGATTGNQLNVNPQLGILASNGGPTQTHGLLAGSPAIDAGDPNFNNTSTPYDQRGFVFLRKSSGAIDIGAYEVQGAADTTPPTISISAPSVALANPGGTVTYTVTYADANFLSSSLTPGNVTLNRSGTINASVSVTSSTVFTRTVTLSGITGYGTIGISIVAGTATDSSGNTAPAAGPSSTFTVNPSVETVQRSGTIRAAEGGGYQVGFIGNPGQDYTIQFSADLLPPWQTLGTQAASSSGVITILDNPPLGTPKRFYRLLLP